MQLDKEQIVDLKNHLKWHLEDNVTLPGLGDGTVTLKTLNSNEKMDRDNFERQLQKVVDMCSDCCFSNVETVHEIDPVTRYVVGYPVFTIKKICDYVAEKFKCTGGCVVKQGRLHIKFNLENIEPFEMNLSEDAMNSLIRRSIAYFEAFPDAPMFCKFINLERLKSTEEIVEELVRDRYNGLYEDVYLTLSVGPRYPYTENYPVDENTKYVMGFPPTIVQDICNHAVVAFNKTSPPEGDYISYSHLESEDKFVVGFRPFNLLLNQSESYSPKQEKKHKTLHKYKSRK